MKKILLIFLLLIQNLFYSQILPSEKEIIISDFNENLKSVLKIHKDKNFLVDVNILDTENKSYLDFLYTQNYIKHDEELATLYLNNLSRNNQLTKLCFVLYENNTNIVKKYMKYLNISYEDTIDYLSLHEMGHCIYDYYKDIYPSKYDNLNPKDNELLADFFAFAFLYKKQKEYLFKPLIENLSKISVDDIHKNDLALKNFINDIKSIENIPYKEIFNYCYKILKNKN